MKIGERLRELRVLLGLTQEQMASQVISKSFYSKVEQGKSEIKILDLLAILKNHEIALTDFFDWVDVNEKGKLLLHFFNNQDYYAIEKLLKQKELDELLQIEAKLMLAILDGTISKFSQEEKEDIRRKYLYVGNIDTRKINKLRFVLPIVSDNEATLIMEQVFESFSYESHTREYLIAVSKISLNYLKRTYYAHLFTEATKAIQFVNSLPAHTYLFLEKLTAQYYEAILQNDKKKIYEINTLLELSGFDCCKKHLPKLKE